MAIRSRPPRFATKQARSAARSTVEAVAPSTGNVATADRGAHAVAGIADRPPRRARRRASRRPRPCPGAASRTRRRRSGTTGRVSRPFRPIARAIRWRSSSPAWWPSWLLTSRKSSRSSMIRLNGAAGVDAALEHVLEGPVVEQAGQVVGLGADLDRPEDLRVLQRDRDLRREQLDQLELVRGERVVRRRAARSSRTPIAPSRPRSGTTIRLPSWALDRAELVDARVGPLVRRCRSARCARRPRSRCRSRRAPRARGTPWRGRRARSAASAGRSPGPATSIAMLSQATSAPRRSVMLSRTIRPSNWVRIDSVIWSSSRWLRTCRSSAALCSRSCSVVSALAIAWAAKLA